MIGPFPNAPLLRFSLILGRFLVLMAWTPMVCALMLPGVALAGAGVGGNATEPRDPRPRLLVMSDLALFRGEGTIADVMAGRVRRAALLGVLDAHYALIPVDELTAGTLPSPRTLDAYGDAHGDAHRAAPVLLLVQPRRLAPSELVALDGWIRSGGRAMIFADPWLVWPSRYPLGDPRRTPPVSLLDPLLDHWGLVLGDSDGARREGEWDGVPIVTLARGDLTVRGAAAGCAAHHDPDGVPNPVVVDCRLGSGRAMVVGDVDLLDERLWQVAAPQTPQWVLARLDDLSGRRGGVSAPEADSSRAFSGGAEPLLAAVGVAAGGTALILWRRRRRKATGR